MKLDLTESYFGENGVIKLAQGIKNLNKLEHLDLNLAFNDYKDLGGHELILNL